MAKFSLTCPNCLYEAPAQFFDIQPGNKLKCRRCRGSFDDPDAYRRDATYADCDFDAPVTEFPYALDGSNAFIRVREGYLAYLTGSDGRESLLESGLAHISDCAGNLNLYYICLNPVVVWGSVGIKDFGVHGTAQLSLSREFVRAGCLSDHNFVLTLEGQLKTLVCRHLTDYINNELKINSAQLLTQPGGYMAALGVLQDGVRLTRVNPQGYRNANSGAETIASFEHGARLPDTEDTAPEHEAPIIKLSAGKAYDVGKGDEDVFFFKNPRTPPARHKAGEHISDDMLSGVEYILRFKSKHFEFPFGWGLYTQQSATSGSYCANGTVSFYVDSTEKVGDLVIRAGDYDKFVEQFFNDVLRKEFAYQLRELVNRYCARKGFDPANIASSLSALSVDLFEALNGEGFSQSRQNAFFRYGLRVSRLDILKLCFYDLRS